ncbi:hypothetical protein B0T19DRAFT_409952 [Cercophora scortea]|uniref:Uncharacterized protein n=1 Tax=Cercophora scortea TaxID=314031 RepID=A0AAE0J4U8_9PEZI|nr:hypothetical protein B0T19DRAFT_409952 [Cercophora scortea]
MCFYRKIVFSCSHSEFLDCVKLCFVAEAWERGKTEHGCSQMSSHGVIAVRVQSECKRCIQRQAEKARQTASIMEKIQSLRDELEKLRKINRDRLEKTLSKEEQPDEEPEDDTIQRAEEQGRQLAEQFGDVGVSEGQPGSSEDSGCDSKSSGEQPVPEPEHTNKMPETEEPVASEEKNTAVVNSRKPPLVSRLPRLASSRR